MSVAVLGAWESGYSYPLLEADHWRFPLRDFGVERWIMAPRTGIIVPELTEVQDLWLEITAQAQKRQIVFVDENGHHDLPHFEHPDRACYVFGRTGYSPLRAHGASVPHQSLRIPTAAGSGLLWAHQAAVVTLYDREVKRGRHRN